MGLAREVRGQTHFVGLHIDLGAYESQATLISTPTH